MAMRRGYSRSRQLFTGRVAPSSSATNKGVRRHSTCRQMGCGGDRPALEGACVTREVVARPELASLNPILDTVNPIAAPVNPTSTAPDAITAPAATRWPPPPSPRHSTTPS
ncbi:hypothetical protein B9479_008380, partial [Cryptococcus floricola]